MEWELFGFELSVFESVSSRKNISDLRHALMKIVFWELFEVTTHGLIVFFISPSCAFIKNIKYMRCF